MVSRGHRELEHTADLALEVWAPGLAELFEEGAQAIVELVTGGAVVGAGQIRELEVSAVNREELFVAWLNEVLFRALTEGFLLARVRFEFGVDTVTAKIEGEEDAFDKIASELKSVTYNGTVIREDPNRGLVARVVIDI